MLLKVIPTDEGFRVEGELDMATAPELLESLQDAVETGGPIVLDFSGVTFMDSTGLRAVLQAVRALDGEGVLVLERPSDRVRRVLDISLPGGVPRLEIRD
jgi:anti-anti-sigma factor